MSSFNKTILPTLGKLAFDIVYNNALAVLLKSTMMFQQTAKEEVVRCLMIILKEISVPVYIENVKDQKVKPSLLPNGDNVMQVLECYKRNGLRPEQTSMDFGTMQAISAVLTYAFCVNPFLKHGYKNRFEAGRFPTLVVGCRYEMEHFRKPHDESGCGIKPYPSAGFLEDLVHEMFPFINLKFVSKNFFQFLLETKGFLMKILVKQLMPVNTKPMILNPNNRKVGNEKREFLKISKGVPKPNKERVFPASVDAQTCQECREHVKTKMFFDERRFGILEKCGCVICYGCLRNLVGGSNGTVKGPLKCPRCFVRSKNVASNSRWIQGEEKVQFFKEYCNNLENTYIKMRLGWNGFFTRKDDLWARVP